MVRNVNHGCVEKETSDRKDGLRHQDLDRLNEESSLTMADEVANVSGEVGSDSALATAPSEELSVQHIVRPHLFHTQDVSGTAVPTMRSQDGKPEVENRLYVRWHHDDRREDRELEGGLELPDQGKLWLSPIPTASLVDARNGWSVIGRQQFLRGGVPSAGDVYCRLAEAFDDFLEFPEGDGEGKIAILSLWTILTYAYPAWDAVPYLAIGGTLGSGKTRVFEILANVVHAPISSASMTAPCIFRTLHSQGGTLLLDEGERFGDGRDGTQEQLSILQSGYKKGNPARRLEKRKDGGFDTCAFDVYGPKAIAGISSLPATLESRCIRLFMHRASDSSKARRRVNENPDRWTGLRDDLYCLALCKGPEFMDLAVRTDLCSEFSGRSYEVWQPLVGLAELVEREGVQGLVTTVLEFARSCVEAATDLQTPEPDEIVLQVVTDLVRGGVQDKRPCDVLEIARRRRWDVFGHWSPKRLSDLLRRYGITVTRPGGRRTYKDVSRNQLEQIEAAYGLDLGLRCGTSDTSGTESTGLDSSLEMPTEQASHGPEPDSEGSR